MPDTSSLVEAGCLEQDFITQAEVTTVVKNVDSGKSLGVNVVFPDLAVMADTYLQHCVAIRDSSLGLANWYDDSLQ